MPVRLSTPVEDESLFVEGRPLLEEAGLTLEDAVVATTRDGMAYVTISIMSGFT